MNLDKKIWWRKFTKTNKTDRKKFLKRHYKTLGYSKVPKIDEFKNDFDPKNNKVVIPTLCNKAKEKEELDKLNEQRIISYWTYFRPTGELFNASGELSDKALRIIRDEFINVDNKSAITTIKNIYILDCSWSMSEANRMREANKAIWKDIENLKILQSENKFLKIEAGIFKFSDSIIGHDHVTDINDAKESMFKGKPTNGTALYDTICTVLKDVKSEKNVKYLFKIFTDGLDVSSYKYTSKDVRNLINTIDATVTFSCSKQDKNAIVRFLGIDESNVLTHDNTGESIRRNSVITTSATSTYVKKVIKGEKVNRGFYKQIK